MRILHTSDWHLGRCLEQYSRLEEQSAFLEELNRICQAERVDLLLVAGDVFDAYNPPAAAETLFYDALERLSDQGRRAIVVIAGNHDNPDRLAAAAPLAYQHGIILLGYPLSDTSELMRRRSGYPDIIQEAGPGFLRIKPQTADCEAAILTLPFPSEARLAALSGRILGEVESQLSYSQKIGQILAKQAAEHFSDATVNLVAAHFFVQGGWPSDSERILQLGTSMLVDPACLPAAAHYIALGHLHRAQMVSGSPALARYAGSPLAYSFSESGYAKSVCLVDASPGQPAISRTIPLVSGRPLRRWQAREGYEQALAWTLDKRDDGCWVDLEIVTDRLLSASEIRDLREQHPGILYIRTIMSGSAAAASMPANRLGRRIDELFAEYYQFRNGVPIPEDVLATFIEMTNPALEEKA